MLFTFLSCIISECAEQIKPNITIFILNPMKMENSVSCDKWIAVREVWHSYQPTRDVFFSNAFITKGLRQNFNDAEQYL